MELLDNKLKLLGDDLKQEIFTGSKVRIIASYFSIYAFEALKEELNNIQELSFIFPTNTFVDQSVKDRFKKEKREYYIPKRIEEHSLYGTEFEIKLKNRLSQKAIAKECAEWIKDKVIFKSNVSEGNVQNFISVTSKDMITTYTPINGFTSIDLGYEKNNMMLQGIVKNQEYSYSKFFCDSFDALWHDKTKMVDVTQNIIDYISSAYVDNSPEFVYFVTLYNIFNEFLEDIMSEDYMPNEGTGFKTSLVWNKLYQFQKDGVIGVINKLEKYNGCILADSVGLGKTFTALGVMKYYACRNKNILVLTPKRLANNWNKYRDNVKSNIFYKDRIHFDVLFHTDLGRTRGNSNGHDLSQFNWDNYDLIVIDESHNFRNANSYRDRETRYDFLLNKVLKEGVKTKVLMLSATPVNNRFNDLKNQLALAYGDDYEEFNQKLDTTKNVDVILRNAQQVFNDWTKLPKEERKSSDLISKLDIDFSILLDNVTIARSRKHISKYYDISEIGKFPKRLEPLSYYCDIAKKEDILEYREIYEILMKLTMAVYAPMNYILDSKKSKYEELYDTKVGATTLKQINREKALQKLMTINMLKRLESCVESFRITLNKIKNYNTDTLDKIISFQKNKTEFSFEGKQITEEDLENEDFDLSDDSTIGKIKIELSDMDLRAWKKDLEKDIESLELLYELMSWITPEKDLKLQKLLEIIQSKIEKPFNLNNRKILIFSAFADTTNYLYDNIAPLMLELYGLHTARIQGATNGNAATIEGNKDTDRLLSLFSPMSKERDLIYPEDKDVNIDILIATDCVSEGQNLQDCDICINYDIHWNPVRIVQRFGRIDRIGSKNESIRLINFWPNVSLDEYINLNARVENRMTLVNTTATGDDNIINPDAPDLEYRKEQLQKLRDGKLQDLEDVDGTITITDLGLNEFRMDVISYIKKNGEPKNIPNGIYAIVKHNDELDIPKGVIYVLKNRNNEINIGKKNRLHPYYLVYLNEEGNVVHTHMDVKKILDIFRSMCKFEVNPIQSLCRQFNKETKDGYKMDKYSQLLDRCIESIIQTKETNDLENLFNGDSSVLFENEIKGLDDFELITFLVIK
ncbi:MAG: DEAD/DEAH box helicase family protein [Anaeroplasmataceae bacterium]|nr:DEAD/DEAH box helicase family protein [Anaeroplasmataceae bacterium]